MNVDLSQFEFYTFDHSLQRELCLRQSCLHRRELELFKQLHPLQSSPSYPGCLPKFTFLDQEEEKVCFESTMLDGFERGNLLLEGLSIGQANLAIAALAKFHAFSLKHLDARNAAMPFTRTDPLNEQTVKEWLIEGLLELPSSDDYFRRNERAFRDFCLETNFAASEDLTHEKCPIVLCHGNLTAENIFFKRAEEVERDEGGGAEEEVLILGWELARPGNGLSDLAHLLLSSVNSNELLQNLDHFLELYIATFEGCQQQKKGKDKLAKWPKFGPDKPKKQFHRVIPTQLIRVLPKLAWEYRKIVEIPGAEEIEELGVRKSAILGRMINGFEMVRKDYEH